MAPIIAHEVETKGSVPLFIDATGIEVDGHRFERTGKDDNGNRGYCGLGDIRGDGLNKYTTQSIWNQPTEIVR